MISAYFFISKLSTSQQGTEDEKQVYIFDEVPEEKTIEAPRDRGVSETTGSNLLCRSDRCLFQLKIKQKKLQI